MPATTRKPPKRLDGRRAEARGTARENLLDAAERVFAERGYRGASVDDVAVEAGVTKGALYWNFKSKEDLFFALVEERLDRQSRALIRLLETAGSDEATAPAVSRGVAKIIDEQRQVMLLTQEYWSLAVRDPALGERYRQRQQALRDSLAHAIKTRHQTTGVRLTVDPEHLAAGILGLAYGVAMERIADPDAMPDDLLGEMLSLIYDGLVLRAG